eukprot:m.22107 g.22107  ORF g.22107 m.22107 type:complete len:1116 (+) comp28283_c0_seq3:27-3374(+)
MDPRFGFNPGQIPAQSQGFAGMNAAGSFPQQNFQPMQSGYPAQMTFPGQQPNFQYGYGNQPLMGQQGQQAFYQHQQQQQQYQLQQQQHQMQMQLQQQKMMEQQKEEERRRQADALKQRDFEFQKRKLQAMGAGGTRKSIDDMFGKALSGFSASIRPGPANKQQPVMRRPSAQNEWSEFSQAASSSSSNAMPQQVESGPVTVPSVAGVSEPSVNVSIPAPNPAETAAPSAFENLIQESLVTLSDQPTVGRRNFTPPSVPKFNRQHDQRTFQQSMKARTWRVEAGGQFTGLFAAEPEFNDFQSFESAPKAPSPSPVPAITQNQQPVAVLAAPPPPPPSQPLPDSAPAIPSWCQPDSPLVPSLYHQVFTKCRDPLDGGVNTKLIFPLLSASGLPRPMLRSIWSIANKTTPGKLNQTELYVVLGLVACAQSGQSDFSVASLAGLSQAPVPHLPGVVFDVAPPPGEVAVNEASQTGVVAASLVPSSSVFGETGSAEGGATLNPTPSSLSDDKYSVFRAAESTEGIPKPQADVPSIDPNDKYSVFRQAENPESSCQPEPVALDPNDKYSVFRVVDPSSPPTPKPEETTIALKHEEPIKSPDDSFSAFQSADSDATVADWSAFSSAAVTANVPSINPAPILYTAPPEIVTEEVKPVNIAFANSTAIEKQEISFAAFETVSPAVQSEPVFAVEPTSKMVLPPRSASPRSSDLFVQPPTLLALASMGDSKEDMRSSEEKDEKETNLIEDSDFGDFDSFGKETAVAVAPAPAPPVDGGDDFGEFTWTEKTAEKPSFFRNTEPSMLTKVNITSENLSDLSALADFSLSQPVKKPASDLVQDDSFSAFTSASEPQLPITSVPAPSVLSEFDTNLGMFQPSSTATAETTEVGSTGLESFQWDPTNVFPSNNQMTITANLGGSIPLFGAQYNSTQKEDNLHLNAWRRCIEACCTDLTTAQETVERANVAQIKDELISTDEGKDYFSGVTEIYRVACRLRASASDMEDLQSLWNELDGKWKAVRDFLTGTNLQPAPDSFDFSGYVLAPSVQSPDTACGISLLDLTKVDQDTSPRDWQSTSTMTTSQVRHTGPNRGILEYSGRRYFAACANYWCNRVESVLPALPLRNSLL